MPCGPDEVQAGVDTQVDLIGAAWLLLLQHVRLMLVVQKLNDGLPGVAVVDIVPEPGSVDDSQADWQMSVRQICQRSYMESVYP